MNKLDKIETKQYEFSNLYFGLFWLIANIVMLITAIVYFCVLGGYSNTWDNYYELPFRFNFWFVFSIVLYGVAIIVDICILIALSDNDFEDECFYSYNPTINYYINGRRVSEKEYQKEEDKYNDLIAPFIESLKETKKEI